MNKPSTLPKHLDLDPDWSAHPMVEWVLSHKKTLLCLFLSFLALLVFTYRFVAIRTLNAENDFIQVQTVFNRFQQTIPSSTSSTEDSSTGSELEQLIAMMQRYPELKPKYEGPLAQTLLITEQIPQARQFADDIFKRTQPDDLQLFQNYSQASFLISEGRYSDALQQSIQLQSTLDQLGETSIGTNPIHSLLYLYNLIRLAILYQETGQQQEELQSWEALENLPDRIKATLATNQVFKSGNVSLEQYRQERKKGLNIEKK